MDNISPIRRPDSSPSNSSDIFLFEKEPPLHAACRRADIDTVRKLLQDPGIDILLLSHHYGETALHTVLRISSQKARYEIVKMLIAHNASIATLQDQKGNTPLHIACKVGAIDIADLLLSYKISSSLQNNAKQTALHILCSCDAKHEIAQHEIMCSLLKYGVDANIQDQDGNTPLHIACKQGYDNLVAQLLEYGADKSLKNQANQTPYALATLYGQTKTVEQLSQEKQVHIANFTI